MTKTYLFIGADRMANAGEADYLKALALTMAEENLSGDIRVCRLQKNADPFTANRNDINRRMTLPANNQEYDRLPIFGPEYMEALELEGQEVIVVGAGQSTDMALVAAVEQLQEKGVPVSAHHITHEIQERQVEGLSLVQPVIYTPTVDDETKNNFIVFPLNSVPHTYTQKICEAEYEKFVQTDNGLYMAEELRLQKRFAIVIVNAGFIVNGVFHPCLGEEAYSNGSALGKVLPTGTHLFIAHGGPRNLEDEKRGEFCLDQYVQGYAQRQYRRGSKTPDVIMERYASGLPYNAVSASFIIAQKAGKNCSAFVSNIEGYGTMMGALQLVPPNVPLIAQPSHVAMEYRQKETEFYKDKGFRIVSSDGFDFDIQRSERENRILGQNPSLAILEAIGLGRGGAQVFRPKHVLMP